MGKVIHLAGTAVSIGGKVTQRCLLCGMAIVDAAVIKPDEPGSFDNPDGLPVALQPGAFFIVEDVRTGGGLFYNMQPPTWTRHIHFHSLTENAIFERLDDLPPGCCILEGRPSIVLHGGPLDGGYHHVEQGVPVPNRFGVRRGSSRHWYETKGQPGRSAVANRVYEAKYIESERAE
jgi:hypothetical protein